MINSIYVDDCLLIGTTKDVNNMKLILKDKYSMKDLDEAKKIIGIEIDRTEDRISIHQQGYIKDILKRFNMDNSRPISTPIVKDNNSDNNSDNNAKVLEDRNRKLYQKIVGALNHLACGTRPDISYAVAQVSRKLPNPNETDFKKVKRILRYINGTSNLKLTYTKSNAHDIIGYSDASYAEDTDRKSTSGFVFTMNGAAISWSSKKQDCISLSTMEAELIALTEAAKQGLWWKKLTDDTNTNLKLTILEDNQATIQHVKNATFNSTRAKHIDTRYKFVNECINKKLLEVKYVSTQDQTADILTKALSKLLFQKHVIGLGLTT
jgi:hypothetical protein